MSDTETKKVSNTVAVVAGVLAVGGTVFGGGMKAAEYQAEIEKARAEAVQLKEDAIQEKEEAIAACEAAAKKGMNEQQIRIELLLRRFDALAKDRALRPDVNQYKNFRQLPDVFPKGKR